MNKACEAAGWNGEVGFAVFCLSAAAVAITFLVLLYLKGKDEREGGA